MNLMPGTAHGSFMSLNIYIILFFFLKNISFILKKTALVGIATHINKDY